MHDPVAALLEPRSVAVVGASNNPLKRGYQAIRRLQADGFPHPIYPVHPREQEILGLPAYPSVQAVEGPVDLALVVTPAAIVPEVLRDCGAKGVRAAVVIAVGFGEMGEQGRALEDEVARLAREQEIAVVGPNTNGVFNLHERLNLVGVADVPRGSVALLCQSGNMALSLFSEAAATTELGFGSYVGIGNEAGLRYHDILEHLRDDARTEAVLIYAEGFRDGRAFLDSASRLARVKPVVCYKAGRSEVARRSALSHTGAVAGSPRLSDALLRQAGVLVVDRADELLGVCEAAMTQPPLRTPRVGVLTDGGGHGTVAADALARLGLELPALGEPTRDRLAGLLPPAASTRNPVDVAGATDQDPGLFVPCLEAMLDDPAVDGILCVGLLGGYGIRFSDTLADAEEAAAARMAELAATHGKALVVQSAYAHSSPAAHGILRRAGVPVHGSIESAARSVAALAERGRFLATAGERSPFSHLPRTARGAPRALTEPEGRGRLAAHGYPLGGSWALATDPAGAAQAVDEIDAPVAMKLVSPDVTHKSDVGGVVLDVRTPEEARDAYSRIVENVQAAEPSARIDGVLVAPMAPGGVELMVGVTTDPSFGPVVAVGAGGTAVEMLDDTAFRALPVTRLECQEMLDELTIAPLLDGFRGSEPVDRASLVGLLQQVSRLVEADPELLELDLNPVIAHPGGAAVVDVRVVVAAGEPVEPSPDRDGDQAPATRTETSPTGSPLRAGR